MPELPDVAIYIEALEKRILGRRLESVRIVSSFLLRSVEPQVASAIGKKVVELRRVGKRICIGLEGNEIDRNGDAREEESAREINRLVLGETVKAAPGRRTPEGRLQKAGPTTECASAEKWDAGPSRINKSAYATEAAEIWLVLHLMIAGRLHWKERTRPPGKVAATTARGALRNVAATTASRLQVGGHSEEGRLRKAGPTTTTAEGPLQKVAPTVAGTGSAESWAKLSKKHLAAFDFENGSLLWTEAGSQKRASLHLALGEAGLAEFDRGGLEIFGATKEEFAKVLRSENHTLKRALTDPEWFSGIGNAYSDEILWEAKLSPLLLTQKMTWEEIARLYEATRKSLEEWTERLRAETGEEFPEGVTAFRPEMAVHGKYKQACPRCGEKVQRIKYAANETNYCPRCQTGGKLLADRAFSRLLREDWPRTVEELEMKMRRKEQPKN